jgi:predicted nucleic acid-binding Zn ribbon protein
MEAGCPKCGKAIPDDAVYCPYCGRGIQPSARSFQVSAAGAFMITFTVASLVLFVLSFRALLNIYSWYPASVAQVWFVYDQMLTAISFTGLIFGLGAAIFILSRRNYRWAMVFSILGTLIGGGSWVISMVIPHSNVAYSTLYFFIPLLATSLAATLMVLPRKAEFSSIRSR